MDLRINETRQTGVVRIPPLPFYRLVGTVSNSADAVRLETAPTGGRKCLFIVDLRINETRQTGVVRKPHLPFYRLVGTVSNSADAVRLETAPTGGRKCLFIFRIHHKCPRKG